MGKGDFLVRSGGNTPYKQRLKKYFSNPKDQSSHHVMKGQVNDRWEKKHLQQKQTQPIPWQRHRAMHPPLPLHK